MMYFMFMNDDYHEYDPKVIYDSIYLRFVEIFPDLYASRQIDFFYSKGLGVAKFIDGEDIRVYEHNTFLIEGEVFDPEEDIKKRPMYSKETPNYSCVKIDKRQFEANWKFALDYLNIKNI
ncbi:hypothetical protein ACFODO_07790 [Acinetobacter sichuanensis]|uniref:Uncharacterized protein n=1 Tax=Acinetobacter sichuanensis TaxID=2136183 RepID=A0A371YK10_9GAMM|nr:hypothetical protein [Acinetobacter sichuanensis]RFC81797.1 hypothetical protein C9E89_019825 [Acinetobacter sichuanensis]